MEWWSDSGVYFLGEDLQAWHLRWRFVKLRRCFVPRQMQSCFHLAHHIVLAEAVVFVTKQIASIGRVLQESPAGLVVVVPCSERRYALNVKVARRRRRCSPLYRLCTVVL